MRRRLPWLIALPLSIAGAQVAHAFAYTLAFPDPAGRTVALAATGHGYVNGHLLLALVTFTVAVGFLRELRSVTLGHRRAPVGAGAFAVAPLALFVLQEVFERLAHTGAFPTSLPLDRVFWTGVALQLPFALAAWLTARLLLRAARILGGRLGVAPRRPRRRTHRPFPVAAFARRFSLSLALGWSLRGPPRPVVH